MKTLMATDGSKYAVTALRSAARLLRKSDNQIDTLCVTPEFNPGGEKRTRARQEYQRRITGETKSILETARQSLGEEGFDGRMISESGSPAEVIIHLANSYEVTVVGAKGRYEGSDIGLGPVASRVVEHAPGIILVGRELTTDTEMRVLVPIDGSRASKRALNSLAEFFNLGSAEITLIHVKETPWIHLGLDREWFDYPDDLLNKIDTEVQFEHELEFEAEDLIEEARAEIGGNYSVLTVISEGNPATEILGEAENGQYDLIVLGSTGAADTKHDILGSVSARVAWQAPCSVAVVKRAG